MSTSNIDPWDDFIQWDESSRNLIKIKKIYIDITNNLNAGILLDQIIYWNLPSKNSEMGSKLRIWKNGELWLAKRREDWWDEIRLTPKQYDSAIKILKQFNIVRTEVFKFHGDPTTHIALNKDVLLELLEKHKKQLIKAQKQAENADEASKTPMDSGSSSEGNKEMPHGGIRKSTKGEEPITEITTETTSMFSKENISVSSRNTKDVGNLNQDKSLDAKSTCDNLECKSKTQALRDGAKDVDIQPSKCAVKEFKECPIKYEPFLEAWEQYTGRFFRGINDSYEKSWKAIRKAVTGKLFNAKNTPCVDESYYGNKLTLEDWIFTLERFALMRNNAGYYPNNKKSAKSLNPHTFLYNKFGNKQYAQSMSYFIHCLENKPKQLQANTIKDTNPAYTKYIIEECEKHFGWDMSNGGRQDAIKCAERLSQFFEDNKDNIHLFDTQYKFTNQQVGTLIEVLQRNESQDHPVKPIYLHTDLTYKTFLPEHLKRVGSMS